jgi:hypothetical protein
MTARMRFSVAAGLAAIVSLAAARAEAGATVAITEFQSVGGESPALAQQLEDEFVLGLVRYGVQVLDAGEMKKRLDGRPELQHCDSSPCRKTIGQQLEVKYLVNVRVDLTGNSYKTVVRVFSTDGAPTAELPVVTKSKTCDVCTVLEARESMLRIADMLRPQLEEAAPAAPAPPPPPPPRPASLAVPIVAAMVGVVTAAVGFAVIGSNGTCTGTLCSENRSRSALGGALVGAGAVTAVAGGYVTLVRSRGGDPVTGVAVAFQF